uniref:Uncharacterized protein n=1 Tax=Lepeophtheirus salmonis TaxID=72036 RepID=A0A0K2T2Q0_LEPSM
MRFRREQDLQSSQSNINSLNASVEKDMSNYCTIKMCKSFNPRSSIQSLWQALYLSSFV